MADYFGFRGRLLSLLFMAVLAGDVLFAGDVKPVREILNRYCADCHTGSSAEADVELDLLDSDNAFRQRTDVAQKILETLRQNQMPPPDSLQPTESEHQTITDYLAKLLSDEAAKFAGDPGPVVLRRLNNVEYTNSIRDVTKIKTFDPAKEFPVDGAAGEGFTNAGNALSMSPAMLTKYLDAARDISQHAVLLPNGIRFSESISPRDWTEEVLNDIRALYAKYSAKEGGTQVNLQGVVFNTNDGGRLPIESYLIALQEEITNIDKEPKAIDSIAQKRGLSPKYLAKLYSAFQTSSNPLIVDIAKQLYSHEPEARDRAIRRIEERQRALWKFSSVGHIGKKNGPSRWMEPVNPIAHGQEFRVSIPVASSSANEIVDQDIVLYLSTSDAGDGTSGDEVVWERPRFVSPGRPELLLKDCDRLVPYLRDTNQRLLRQMERCLAAADWVSRQTEVIPIESIAREFGCDNDLLAAWLEYLGLHSANGPVISGHLKERIRNVAGYNFVSGWTGADALSVIANSSTEHVRIPGNLAPQSLLVHPAPSVQIVVGWKSPIQGAIRGKGSIQHAHPECGNGVQWTLQLRRGATRQALLSGVAHGPAIHPIDWNEPIVVNKGDCICLVVNPRNGDHSCDATAVNLTFEQFLDTANSSSPPAEGSLRWDLASDVSSNLMDGNPHADTYGNSDIWHFFGEPIDGREITGIPAGSSLARWQTSSSTEDRSQLSQALAHNLTQAKELGLASPEVSDADRILIRQLTALAGPLMSYHLREAMANVDRLAGKQLGGETKREEDIEGVAPNSVLEIRVPASLIAGSEFVTYGRLAAPEDSLGSVQMYVSLHPPIPSPGLHLGEVISSNSKGTWTDATNQTSSQRPVIVSKSAMTEQKFESMFAEFRELFPAALCYNKIVPVDEVVTLTLYYREDDALQRLMLSDVEIAYLDRLWDELHYVSRDALSLVDAYDQLWQYATQDADPSAFEPLRQPILDRAEAFRKTLKASEPSHLAAVSELAARAFRRPLLEEELEKIQRDYLALRQSELDHEMAIRSLITRILISPSFLYKSERGVGDILPIADGSVSIRALSDYELATRLSYFLTASPPDEELLRAAETGELIKPEVLKGHTRRLLQSDRVISLAMEFGCQWLQVYQFDQHDEKSEAAFPGFAEMRGDMYKESILFWAELFRTDASLLQLLDADFAFVNQSLATHYGFEWDSLNGNTGDQISVPGFEDWIKVHHTLGSDRGGVLTMASVLSKQSGASRTSPILRGNWVSEVLLGEKLPKPPKDVPVLPESAPEGLTERQLIEMHSSAPACAKCHAKIDPFGFAWEGFDAIGRRRDSTKYDTKTELPDGTKLEGWIGLRNYLMEQRRDDFVRQFCKKLLGYSLGRAVQLSDEVLINDMIGAMESKEYRISVAIDKILESQQFRYIRIQSHNSISGVQR
ncbi:DUF1592 domain-containing protein [Pirellulaceae bacterium SH449]